MSGNEAIALGAWEAGVRVGTAYPGTPATEILEELSGYEGVYTEWSVNEKVALEVALGAAVSGARALVAMKHVGMNVAADPLFTASYVGVAAGLVIANADDPDMHSSQNEQDNRHYARAAKLPMLEPADAAEARAYTRRAFELSEACDTPVIVRSTTRLSHSKSVVTGPPDRRVHPAPAGFVPDAPKYVMLPSFGRKRHLVVEERMRRLAAKAETMDINRVEPGEKSLGIVTAGVAYAYAREVFPRASILKLGMVHPLPARLVRDFCAGVERVVVIEELDPFLQDQLLALGIRAEGKEHLPRTGELSPGRVAAGLGHGALPVPPALSAGRVLPPRPPALCQGCPHRTVFEILRKLDVTVAGDIGCYTLGALAPFEAIDTCIEMGGSIGMAQGIELAEPNGSGRRSVAVIGDSTFAHAGLAGLLNAAYNGRHALVIVLDNGTTAMTGMQPNPCSGERIDGRPAPALDYLKLAEAVGIGPDNARRVDAYRPDEVEGAIRELLGTGALSLLVIEGPCVILRRKRKKQGEPRDRRG